MSDMFASSGYKFEIDTTPNGTSRTWVIVGGGLDDFKKTLNDVVQSFSFLSDGGWGSSEVFGAQLKAAFNGHRITGDAAQDYIFGVGVMYNFGSARKTNFRITDPNGNMITGGCTLANIDDTGGKATEGAAISFDVLFNGKPTFSAAPGPLTVVSVAGATAGATMIYVNPAKGSGDSYVYKMAVSVSLPDYGATLASGWTAWDGSSAISGAVTGQQIVVAELSSTGTCLKAGLATVTAHA